MNFVQTTRANLDLYDGICKASGKCIYLDTINKATSYEALYFDKGKPEGIRKKRSSDRSGAFHTEVITWDDRDWTTPDDDVDAHELDAFVSSEYPVEYEAMVNSGKQAGN